MLAILFVKSLYALFLMIRNIVIFFIRHVHVIDFFKGLTFSHCHEVAFLLVSFECYSHFSRRSHLSLEAFTEVCVLSLLMASYRVALYCVHLDICSMQRPFLRDLRDAVHLQLDSFSSVLLC